MVNIVPQCETINCYLDGNILLGKIEEVNVPDPEEVETGLAKMDVELKVRGEGREILAAVGRAAGKPNTVEIHATYYREAQQASWFFRGRPMNIPQTVMSTTTLTLNVNFYEHTIDGEEKYYIDILNYIRRIEENDLLAATREALGI